jgi:hypothetical protein
MTDGRTVVPANEFAWKYDIENDLWTRLQSTNQPPTRYNHSATVDDSGTRVLFAGGSLNNKKFYSDIWQFTFATQQWQQLSLNLPTGRAGHIMWQSLDQWFLFGGYNGDGGFNYLVDMHKVQESTLEKVGDVSANEWQVEDLKGTVPFTARPIIYQKYGDYLLVFGGYDGKGPSAELNVMDMKSARFFPVQLWLDIDPDEQIQIETVQPAINSAQVSTTGATKPTARYGHCMIILPPSSNNENESRLLVFGGGGSLYLNDLFMIEIPSKVA